MPRTVRKLYIPTSDRNINESSSGTGPHAPLPWNMTMRFKSYPVRVQVLAPVHSMPPPMGNSRMEPQHQISTNSLMKGFDNTIAYETTVKSVFKAVVNQSLTIVTSKPMLTTETLRKTGVWFTQHGIAHTVFIVVGVALTVLLTITAHPKVGKVGCIKSDGPPTYEKLREGEAALSIIWSCHFQRAERVSGGLFDPDDLVLRSVSAVWFDVVCPPDRRRYINMWDVKPAVASTPGIEVLTDWQQLLLAVPERCIEIVLASWDEDMFSQTFDLGVWGSDRILSLWDTFSASPISCLLESPLLLGARREYDATLDLMYLLTNEKGQWIDELKSVLKADGWSILTSRDLVLGTEQTDVPMAVEMETARCAAVFVGNRRNIKSKLLYLIPTNGSLDSLVELGVGGERRATCQWKALPAVINILLRQDWCP
ncbi:hypothetical protein B0H10DRAFT_2185658 [Mycena sp. CBHHK59/15]|nr:hypothetical protein B0H10DRAFT_2185658 [Mycena sp. CBHHK59/15]